MNRREFLGLVLRAAVAAPVVASGLSAMLEDEIRWDGEAGDAFQVQWAHYHQSLVSRPSVPHRLSGIS